MHSIETGIYNAILTGTFILCILIIFFVTAVLSYQKKRVLLKREKLKAEMHLLDQERSRIASDLHDDLGASLSAIKLRLHYLEPSKEEEAGLVKASEGYIDEAMLKLKRISFNMMPQILERTGLCEALNEFVEMQMQGTKIKATVTCNANINDMEKKIHIYRIVQAIVTNVIRHANAATVTIIVEQKENMIELNIKDDGIGFNKHNAVKKRTGLGLQNIMARTDLLKGRIYLNTELNKGTSYLIKIPA